MKTTKDNLTDLVSDLTQPKPTQEKPQVTPPQGLNDYQVYTPDGETIDLTLDDGFSILEKSGDGKGKKVYQAMDKKGRKYILVILPE